MDSDHFCEEVRAAAIHQALEWLVWWGPHRAVPQPPRRFRRFVRELETRLTERPAPDPVAAQAVS